MGGQGRGNNALGIELIQNEGENEGFGN